MSYQDNSHALCLGLWLLSKQDQADDFEQWQDDNRLPTTYTDGQVQEALFIFPDDYDRVELMQYAKGYVESQR
jgi:hypothetical protein